MSTIPDRKPGPPVVYLVVFVDEMRREFVYNVCAQPLTARLKAKQHARTENFVRTPKGEEIWPSQFGHFLVRPMEIELQ